MKLAELEKRVKALEEEVRQLRAQLRPTEPGKASWLDLFGKYRDDPTFEEAVRLGREYRDQVNRESLEEFDREEEEAKKAAARKKARGAKKSGRRKADART